MIDIEYSGHDVIYGLSLLPFMPTCIPLDKLMKHIFEFLRSTHQSFNCKDMITQFIIISIHSIYISIDYIYHHVN